MNKIHDSAIVEDSVEIGEDNYIGPYCHISGNTVIGNGNRFEGFCSIGSPPENRGFFEGSPKRTVIGNENVFREFVTINAGTLEDTLIGDDNIFLKGSHVGHDSILENGIVLSCSVSLAGFTYVMSGANFGLNSACHQFSVIGAYAMIGMGAMVGRNKKIEPGKIYVKNPIKFLKINRVGLSKNGIGNDELESLNRKYLEVRLIYLEKQNG